MHTSDTVQEKLSLYARFGVTIYYGAPDKKEFQKIVTTLAEKYGVRMVQEELLLEANKWELAHGGLSGRTGTAVYQLSAWKTIKERADLWQSIRLRQFISVRMK